MARWGEIPNVTTDQELISLNKKLDKAVKELNALKPKLAMLVKVDPDSSNQTIIEIEEIIQELNSLKTKRKRLINLLRGDE